MDLGKLFQSVSVKFQVNTSSGCGDRTCMQNHDQELSMFTKGNNSGKIVNPRVTGLGQ